MKNRKAMFRLCYSLMLMAISVTSILAQDTVKYIGETLSNVDYHHGQLSPAMGVHNIQVFRANREHPQWAGGNNFTYNHAPMLAYWNQHFFLEYLSCPVGEHVPPGQTLLLQSSNGYDWSRPTIIFPPYPLKDGTVKEGRKDSAHGSFAVMHQRIGFYVASTKRMLAQGYYGIVLGQKDDPNDGNGIGRVVREIYADGKFGPIYFIRYNHGFNEKNTLYPLYSQSTDKGFVAACNELLSKPLMMQQWVEEADRNDSLIPLKKDFKAFNFYHLPDGRAVGLWKNALTSISSNEGKSWLYSPQRAPGFVNANAKIWGQKTTDGKYATVYNPSEFRWPLAISVSDNGLLYKNLLLVNGEITTMRYGGAYKSYGPQYVRGIQEGEGIPPDNNMWVSYSMNKEDIWVSKIPVSVTGKANKHVLDVFANMPAGTELNEWNIYSPIWAPVKIESLKDGSKVLALRDADPFDYAKAEHLIPSSKLLQANFSISPQQNNYGLLEIEFLDAKGQPCVRISFDSTGSIITKSGYRNKELAKYTAGENYQFKIELNTANRFYTVSIKDKKAATNLFFAPVASIERIVFRTGSTRRFPDADTPTDQNFDRPNAGEKEKEATYFIQYLKTSGN